MCQRCDCRNGVTRCPGFPVVPRFAAVEMCRAELRRRRDAPVNIRASLVLALAFAGSGEEAMVAADSLIEAAEGTGNLRALGRARHLRHRDNLATRSDSST